MLDDLAKKNEKPTALKYYLVMGVALPDVDNWKWY